jgi:hypothetical protein
MTDEGLARLRGLRELRFLSLSFTSIGDPGVANLRGAPNLQVLWLTRTKVTDKCLEDVCRAG